MNESLARSLELRQNWVSINTLLTLLFITLQGLFHVDFTIWFMET